MSLEYRIQRIDNMTKAWGLDRDHDLIASLPVDSKIYDEFKVKIKLYVSKALNFPFENDDDLFIKKVNDSRNNRKNITPNGAVVPKREFQLEYNMVLRDWSLIIKKMVKRDEKLLSIFRFTPNVRIKYAKELEDNVGRALSTSYAHSDAWVEGPWGMNCFIPFFGDTKNNNLIFYEPESYFSEDFLSTSSTYVKMQWVMDHYKRIKKINPKAGHVHIPDYAAIHHTERKKNCGTRISIDTTLFVGNHEPHKDRKREYTSKIPEVGINQFVDAGQSQFNRPATKISTYSHYTSKVLRLLKL